MRMYSGVGPDGKEYEIAGPEGISQEQVDAEIARQIGVVEREAFDSSLSESQQALIDAMFPEAAPKEAGFFENVLTGLGAGATGLYESAALGIATALDEENELEVRRIIQETADAIGPEGGDKDSIVYQVAQGVGSILGLAPTALLGFAAIPVGGVIAASAGAGEASERAREEGASEEDRGSAAFKGTFVGATEILPLGRVFSAFKLPFLQDLAQKIGPEAVRDGGSRIVNAAATGGVEAAQEATAEFLQNAIESGYNPDQELIEGLGGAAGIGGASGAIVDLLVNAFVKKGKGGNIEPSDESQEVLGLPAPQPKLPGGTGFQPTTLPDGSVANTPEELMAYQRTQQEKATPKLPKPPTEEELFERGDFEEIARQRAQAESGRAVSPPEPDTRTVEEIESEKVRELVLGQRDKADTEQKKTEQLARIIQQEEQTKEGDLFPFEKRAGRAGRIEQPRPQQPRYMDQQTEIEGLESVPEAEARAQARQQIEMFSPQRQRGGVRREARLPKAESGVVPQAKLRQPQRRLGAQQEIQMPTPEQGELVGPRGGVSRRTQPRTQLGPQRAAMPRQTGDQQQLPLPTMPQSGAQAQLFDQQPATPQQPPLIPLLEMPTAPPSVQSQLFDMRGRVRKKPQFEARQPERRPATAVQKEKTQAPEPRIVDDAMMAEMGLAKAAPIRKRIQGKNLALPAEKTFVETELKEHAKNEKVSDQTKFKITKFLEGTTDEAQGEMFGPRGAVQAKLTEKQQQPLEEQEDAGQATEEPQKGRRGTRVQGGETSPRKSRGRRDTRTTEQPKPPRVEDTERDVEPTRAREEPEPTPLEETEVEQVTETKAEAPKGRKAPRKAKEETTEAKQEVAKKDERDPKAVAAMETKAREVIEETKQEAPAPAESTTTPKEVKTKDTTEAGPGEKKTKAKKKVTADRTPMRVATEADQKLKDAQDKVVANPLSALFNYNFRKVGRAVAKDTDKTTVASLLERVADPIKSKLNKREPKNAARFYFGKKSRIEDTLELIAHDLAFGGMGKSSYQATTRGNLGQLAELEDVTSDAENAFFEGLGNAEVARAAQSWIVGNMSPEVIKKLQQRASHYAEMSLNIGNMEGRDLVAEERELDAKRADFQKKVEKQVTKEPEKVDKEVTRQLEQAFGEEGTLDEGTIAYIDILDNLARLRDGLDLSKDAVAASSLPLHPEVSVALEAGNLGKALQYIASTTQNTRVQNAATKLAEVVGDTKVEVIENLDEAGNFNPENNTIQLDADMGMNVHTVLHEMTHAATSATLANKAHPMTQQLNKIFESVKEELDTAYGATNLDEFVAEAFSNPEFRMKLAGITPKGDRFTALERFTNAVMNFMRKLFGMQTKPLGSALTEVDAMVENILAPAPESRNAGKLLMISKEGPQAVRDFANGYGTKITELTKGIRDAVSVENFKDIATNFLNGRAPKLAKGVGLMAMPSQALADIMGRYKIPAMMDLHKLFEEQEGAMSQSDQRLDAELKQLQDWTDANKDKKELFDDIVYMSTTEQVDPTQPESKYKGDKVKVHKELSRMMRELGPEGRKQYIDLRDAYARLFEKMKSVIEGRIDNLTDAEGNAVDQEAKTELRNRIFAKMFDKARIEPYFPLTRKGEFWLKFNMDVVGPDGQTTKEPVVKAFETEAARRAAIAELDTMPEVEKDTNGKAKVETERTPSKFNFDNAPAQSFVGQTMSILQANKVAPEVKDEFLRLFVDTLPETSFAKSLAKRKGTLGYDKDAVGAFRLKAYDIGRQATRLEYSRRIRNAMSNAEEQINRNDDLRNSDLRDLFLTETRERGNFAMNPPADPIAIAARNANRFAFMGTIGFNISSAIVNLSQVPLVVLPYMAGKTSYADATKNLNSARRFFAGAGREHSIMVNGKAVKTKGAVPSIDNYYNLNEDGTLSIREDMELDADQKKMVELMQPLVEAAAQRGLLNRSMFYDSLGAEESGKAKSWTDTLSAYSAFPFHTAERFNRQITLGGTYLNELQRLTEANDKLPEGQRRSEAEVQQEAVDTALYDTQQTNGGAVLSTAARVTQMPLGRVAMMYKGFGIQMYYTQFKTAKEWLYDSDLTPEQKKIAFKQIMGIQGSVLFLSGVQGLTLYGMVAAVANMFLDEDEEDFETITRGYLGEALYKGGVNQILAGLGVEVDVASRIGLSNLIIASNRYNFDPSMEKTIVQTLGGPAYGYMSQVARGVNDVLFEGEVQRGVENILPSAIRNAAKATFRYSDEGILTRRKDPILDDLGTGELVAQFFGFAPAEYTRNQERNQILKGIEKDVLGTRSKLLRKLYIARRSGDSEGVTDTMKEIREFNSSRMGRNYRIDADAMRRSIKKHMETSARMYNGVTLNPRLRNELLEIGEDFNETLPWFMR